MHQGKPWSELHASTKHRLLRTQQKKRIAESLKQAQEAKENDVVYQENEVIADKISENKCGVQLDEESPSSRHEDNFRILQGKKKDVALQVTQRIASAQKKRSGI